MKRGQRLQERGEKIYTDPNDDSLRRLPVFVMTFPSTSYLDKFMTAYNPKALSFNRQSVDMKILVFIRMFLSAYEYWVFIIFFINLSVNCQHSTKTSMLLHTDERNWTPTSFYIPTHSSSSPYQKNICVFLLCWQHQTNTSLKPKIKYKQCKSHTKNNYTKR